MKTKNKNITIGVVLFFLGLSIASVAVTLTSMTDKVIAGTVSAVGQGAPLEMFQYYIKGLLAGGHISIVPVWFIHIMGFLGVSLIYSGVHVLINREKESPYAYWFKLNYWREFQSNIKYRAPVKIKKKRN